MIELPCDTEPEQHGPSYYLTLPCRSFAEAVRDVSKHRDLPEYVWDLLRDTKKPTAEIICLAEYRVLMGRGR